MFSALTKPRKSLPRESSVGAINLRLLICSCELFPVSNLLFHHSIVPWQASGIVIILTRRVQIHYSYWKRERERERRERERERERRERGERERENKMEKKTLLQISIAANIDF